MHKAEPVLRATEGFEHGADALETQFGGLDFVAERIKELDGIGVVHATKNFSALEMYGFSSRRGTTASSMPCFNRNSAR